MTHYKRTISKETKELYDYVLGWAKKVKAIKTLGGKCECCGENSIFKLCFHHKNQEDKEYEIGYLTSRRWSILEKELEKCQLLCFNCHREVHDNKANKENIDYKIKTQNKNILLEYKKQLCCQECGYNKNIKALDFHHTGENNKLFKMSMVVKDEELKENITLDIKDELNKCLVLCSNCHREKHVNMEKFEKYRNEIYLKSESIKENRIPLDANQIEKMYKLGVKQIDIAIHFKASKGCISEILHKLGYGESMEDLKIDESLFLNLHNKGKSQKELLHILNCHRGTLWKLYKKYDLVPNKNEIRIKDINFIIECKDKNMSYREIGKLLNISYVAVRQRYEKYKK